MTAHRDMVAGDLYPTRGGFEFFGALPGPGPWHMTRVGEDIVLVSTGHREMGWYRDGVVTWIDPGAEIQA